MIEPITKAEAVTLAEEDDSLQYMGTIQMNSETRIFYRTAIGAAHEAKGYKIVYVVE